MNTKLLSEKSLTVIDQYIHFKIGDAVTSIPYHNNNHKNIRAALRAVSGKGSPRDIYDEVEIMLVKESGATGTFKNGSFVPSALSDEALKHFLVDHNIGIDCSGFAYYILGAESIARGRGSLDRHLKFPYSKGIMGLIRTKMRPTENADVATFAHDKNSRIITLKEIQPGDMITMIDPTKETERDHILVVSQVEYQNFLPTLIHYTHSVAWPSDGKYGHGVRAGAITIVNPEKSLLEQNWTETKAGKTGENYTFVRAAKSLTEIRRLCWF